MKIDIDKQLEYFHGMIKKFHKEGDKREVENCEVTAPYLNNINKTVPTYRKRKESITDT